MHILRNGKSYGLDYRSKTKRVPTSSLSNRLFKRKAEDTSYPLSKRRCLTTRVQVLQKNNHSHKPKGVLKTQKTEMSKPVKPAETINGIEGHTVVNLMDPEDQEKGLVLKPSGILGDFTYVGGDVPSLMKRVASTYSAFRPGQMTPSQAVKFHRMTDVLSLSNGASCLTGYLNYQQGVKTFKIASKVNDTFGMYQGRIKQVKSPFEFLSGAISLPASMMSIAGVATEGRAALAASSLGMASSVASGVFYLGTLASSCVAVHEIRRNSREFLKEAKQGHVDKAVGELSKLLELDDKAVQKVLDKTFKKCSQKSKDKLVLDSEKFEKALAKVIDAEGFVLNDSEYHMVTSYVSKLIEEKSIAPEDKAKVEALFVSEIKKKYASRQQSFMRTFGEEALDALIKIKVEEKNSLTDKAKLKTEKEKLIDVAKTSVKKKKIIHAFLIASMITVTVLNILGNIFSGGMLYLVMQVVSLVVASVLTGIDLYSLYQSYKFSKVNTKEKMIIAAVAVLMVGTIVAAEIFSGGVAGIVLTAVAGTLLAGTALAGTYYANKELDDDKAEEDSKNLQAKRLQHLLEEMQAFEKKRLERKEQQKQQVICA